MQDAVEICPYCGNAVDLSRGDFVGDGLLACEHCGELFNRSTSPDAGRRDTIGARYDSPVPAIRISPEDAVRQRPAGAMAGVPGISRAAAIASSAPPHRRPLAAFGWTLGILSLLLVLAGQFAYFMREELARHPPLRPLLMQLCDYADCEIPHLRAPAQIRVVARDIRRHPEVRDALRVSLTFSNDAPFTQAYPIVQLSFFDMSNRALARRSFAPEEYLPQNIDMSTGMPAHGALQAVLEIIDPGAEAVNFTFQFL